MPTQAAFMLGPLASFDDAHAARAADTLITVFSGLSRTLREVAYALRWGAGLDTHAILQRLASSPFQSVRKDAEDSLKRREAAVSKERVTND